MKQPVVLAVLALAGVATAQIRGPLPGIPMTPPPVDHPALMNQPLFQPPKPAPAPESEPAKEEKEEEPANKPKPVDPDTVGPKLAGKDLKKVVKKVAGLKWNENLLDARADSAGSGKPILMIQALGEIDGFA
jgi:hypothetical protein